MLSLLSTTYAATAFQNTPNVLRRVLLGSGTTRVLLKMHMLIIDKMQPSNHKLLLPKFSKIPNDIS